MARSGGRTNAGRRGALEEARELVALVSSLSEAGDALSVEAVSARLGVSGERAEKLVGLVATACSADGTGLPLVNEGDGRLTLLLDTGLRGRRLRLDRAETAALLAALDRVGVPARDPLRERLEGSLAGSAPSEELVRRMLGEPGRPAPEALPACAGALLAQRGLRFCYKKPGGGAREGRRVLPERLRCEGDLWYLDAYDIDRRGARTFRLDRMDELEELPVRTDRPAKALGDEPRRTVRLRFSDPRYLDLLPWHDLSVVLREEGGAVVAETPYFGGMWLPRMVAACAGTVICDDPEVERLAGEYAARELESPS